MEPFVTHEQVSILCRILLKWKPDVDTFWFIIAVVKRVLKSRNNRAGHYGRNCNFIYLFTDTIVFIRVTDKVAFFLYLLIKIK